LTARIIEDLGFEAVYLTGAGFTNMALGMPDVGLATASEINEAAQRITDVCGLPLVVDIDTGFGNALNVHRTVKSMERAGAAALQLEDQVFPKRCGHFDGKAVISLPEMLAKIKAACDAREDENLLIIGRTDANAVEGFESALERAHAMAEAGADLIFVEAPTTPEQVKRMATLPVPQMINIVFGGRTPMVSLAELRALQFSLVLYANAALQATIHAVTDVLTHLRDHGSLTGVEERLASFSERQRVVRKHDFDALEGRYQSD